MVSVSGVNALLSEWEENADKETQKAVFRAWRGDHLSKHRGFAGLRQRELGDSLGISQAQYAKLEQANTWSPTYTGSISSMLKVPQGLLHNTAKAHAFLSRDGGITFVKLVESVIERWGDESERADDQMKFPVQFIQDRLDSERQSQKTDERPDRVSIFLADPVANDLDPDTKRWLEQLFDLGPGVLVDGAHYDGTRTERRAIAARMRRNFLSNVERFLEERRWTPADLAIRSCLPLSAIAGADGKLLFQPLRTAQIAGVAMAFGVEPALLTIENGADLQRESAAAFQDLPAMPRSFVSWLHGVLPKVGDESPNAGGAAVAALLPMFRAMLEQAFKDANRNPDVGEAMSLLFTAYLGKNHQTTGKAAT